ncbi:polyprotein [Plakobranchus ocellatus]|uniref:Polyprotein n=1 Tax=Plakobranchus ocellatus TaxID=259542 RepID=A0AAV4BWT4_9GAST|nr:polyprotein [Plakobranchus ocellatus]
MIIDDIRNKEDSTRVQKAVQQPQQGQWTNWDTAIQRSLTWNDIWHMAPLRISFLIRSVYDLLPSNANLVRWGKKDDPTGPLCQGRQTTEHVLSSCKVALSQGRYTSRHNRVLQELASIRFQRTKTTIAIAEVLESDIENKYLLTFLPNVKSAYRDIDSKPLSYKFTQILLSFDIILFLRGLLPLSPFPSPPPTPLHPLSPKHPRGVSGIVNGDPIKRSAWTPLSRVRACHRRPGLAKGLKSPWLHTQKNKKLPTNHHRPHPPPPLAPPQL